MAAGVMAAQAGPAVQRVEMKAGKFAFSPSRPRVKAGVPVQLSILSTDGVHGIAIPGLKINQRLDRGRETLVSFTPTQPGSYPFRCSVMCGQGHQEMIGELIVE
jgi:cytochrome c oxidase subunit 2